MNNPSVEDVESVHPLEVEDEAESLPTYEESVSSGFSAIGADRQVTTGTGDSEAAGEGVTRRDPVYLQRGMSALGVEASEAGAAGVDAGSAVISTAPSQLGEKDQFRRSLDGRQSVQSVQSRQSRQSGSECDRRDAKARLRDSDEAMSSGPSSPASPTLPSYAESSALDRSSAPALARAHSLTLPQTPSASRSTHVHPTPLGHTGLSRLDFGSAYARQSDAAITCALPLYGGSLVLFGSAAGLGVLDTSGRQEVPVRKVWTGLAVWDIRVLRCVVEDGKEARTRTRTKTPKGSVLLLCGGQEESGSAGTPRKGAGAREVRVWRLGSPASLARWSAEREAGWRGLDMATEPLDSPNHPGGQGAQGKGKGKGIFSVFKRTTSTERPGMYTAPPPPDPRPDPAVADQQLVLARAWANDWLGLSSSTTASTSGKPADVLAVSHQQQGDTVYVAISTPTHILLHVGQIYPGGISFRSTRKFYLPFAPSAMGLLEVLTPAGEGSLGIWVSFASVSSGGGEGVASVNRNSDSAVLDFRPPSGQGQGQSQAQGKKGKSKAKGGAEWSGMQSVWTGGREYCAFTRGAETMLCPLPLRFPIDEPPAVLATWPRTATSSLVVPDNEGLVLITTNAAGEIVTQRAAARGGPGVEGAVSREGRSSGWYLGMQDGASLSEGRILPLAWGHSREGVYASVRDGEEWCICLIEKG